MEHPSCVFLGDCAKRYPRCGQILHAVFRQILRDPTVHLIWYTSYGLFLSDICGSQQVMKVLHWYKTCNCPSVETKSCVKPFLLSQSHSFNSPRIHTKMSPHVIDHNEAPASTGRRGPQADDDLIAVIGMSCKFPGDADTPARLWDLCESGRNTWSEVPSARFNGKAFHNPDHRDPGTVWLSSSPDVLVSSSLTQPSSSDQCCRRSFHQRRSFRIRCLLLQFHL